MCVIISCWAQESIIYCHNGLGLQGIHYWETCFGDCVPQRDGQGCVRTLAWPFFTVPFVVLSMLGFLELNIQSWPLFLACIWTNATGSDIERKIKCKYLCLKIHGVSITPCIKANTLLLYLKLFTSILWAVLFLSPEPASLVLSLNAFNIERKIWDY